MTLPNTFDVFVSYRRIDQVPVRLLVPALEAVGLRVWIDYAKNEDFESISRNVKEGIARSRAIIAWYSKNYPDSRACQWELTAAYLGALRIGGNPAERVLVINPESTNSHIHPIEIRDQKYMPASQAPCAEQFPSIAEAIRKSVGRLTGVLGDGAVDPRPNWYGAGGTGSNRFVGRLSDLWQLHTSLWQDAYPMFSATASAALGQLSGLAGVGKSLVAEEYALRFGGAYPGGVFWLRAFGNDGNNQPTAGYSALADQTASIAVALGIHVEGLSHEQVSAALVRTLDRAARPFLWIVDDLPNGLAAADVQSWRAPGRFGKTLITTRSREYDATGSLLRLDVLPAGDAYQLLTKRRPIERNDERAVAMMLATDLLGGHPLALDVASAAVEYYESYAAFMQALAHPSADALDLAKEYVGELPNGHEKSIVATFLTSLARLGPAGTDFIRLSSVLATAPLDLDLTAMIFAADDYAELDEEVDLDKARAKVRSAFSQVDKLSLAEDVNGPVPARSVHGLVSRVVRRDRAPANVERLAKLRIAALTIFTHTLKLTADMRSHPQIEAHVAHARKMVTEEDDEFAAELLGWVGRYDAARADTSTALQAFRRQWALRTRFLGPEHPDTLTAMGNVAWMLSVRGDLANSRRMKEEVLGLCRKVLGPEHHQTLLAMDNLVFSLLQANEVPAARALQEESLAIAQRVFGAEATECVGARANLAEIASAEGNFVEAKVIGKEVLEFRRKVLGTDHPDTLISMNNLAFTLAELGEFREARAMNEEALTLKIRVLGPEHPGTLATMHNLTRTLAALGDDAEARLLLEKLLPLVRQVCGPDDALTLGSMSGLAESLLGANEAEKARPLLQQVLDSQIRLHGPNHPLVLAAMLGVARAHFALNDLEAAKVLQTQAVAEHHLQHGEDDSRTSLASEELALTLAAMGDDSAARSVREQVLARCHAVLGIDHPATLAAMISLGATLTDSGSLIEARVLLEDALERCRRVFGPKHRETVVAACNLLSTLVKLKSEREASALATENLAWLLKEPRESLPRDLARAQEVALNCLRRMQSRH